MIEIKNVHRKGCTKMTGVILNARSAARRATNFAGSKIEQPLYGWPAG
jgi:hypothetical protein